MVEYLYYANYAYYCIAKANCITLTQFQNTKTISMNKFKQYTIEYSFIGSVWSKEFITVTSNNLENAKEQARIEINMAYGSEICKDLIIH